MRAPMLAAILVSGALFGFGLAVSTMVEPEIVRGFLLWKDMGLLLVLGGAAIFGVGWGLSGLCPGPAIAGIGVGNWPIVIALAAMIVGAYVQGRFFPGKTP